MCLTRVHAGHIMDLRGALVVQSKYRSRSLPAAPRLSERARNPKIASPSRPSARIGHGSSVLYVPDSYLYISYHGLVWSTPGAVQLAIAMSRVGSRERIFSGLKRKKFSPKTGEDFVFFGPAKILPRSVPVRLRLFRPGEDFLEKIFSTVRSRLMTKI